MRSAFYNLINFINMTSIHDVYWGAAKTILKNIYKIPDSSITDVAKMCYVSTATISRLCRKLSYESFTDFKKDTYDNLRYEDLIYIVDKIHEAKHICFAGNFFTQSVSMQLQIELSYLGKDCVAMYPLEQQKNIYKTLKDYDLIIVSSIAGGFFKDHIETMRELVKTEAYIIAITQLDEFPYSDKVDMILKVGNDHHSLIGKFSVTYIFEVLEALYHLKYGTEAKTK